MPKPRDEKKKDAIYQAALKIILKEGFSGLKMSQVAKGSGLATGTVYIYFKNKTELINQLYLVIKRRSTRQIFSGIPKNAPFLDAFEKIWYNYLEYNLSKPEEGAFVEQYYRSPYLRSEVVEETDRLLSPIFALLERGKRERLVSPAATPLLVSQLIGGINELVKWHLNGRISLDAPAKEQAFRMAWNSIKH